MKRKEHPDLKPEKFSDWFNKFVSQSQDYFEALNTVRNNSNGGIWLIGGAVYRPLLFGDCEQAKDFDFIVEEFQENFVRDYFLLRSRFGGFKLVKRESQIDIVPLSDVVQIKELALEAKIENYLAHTPFNIHSIAYDVGKKEVIGEVGKKAIREKVLRVHDYKMARRMSEAYSKPIGELLEKKAMEIGINVDSTINGCTEN